MSEKRIVYKVPSEVKKQSILYYGTLGYQCYDEYLYSC